MRIAHLLWKDIRIEARSKESLQAGLVLVGLFFVLYLFALSDLTSPRLATIAVWTPIVYSAAALSSRGLSTEFDRGTMEMLQAMPLPAAWHGWSRTIVNLALTGFLATFTLVLANVGFGLSLSGSLWIIVALAVIGLALLGTLAGAMASQTHAPSILTPILLIPTAAPLLQAGVRGSISIFNGLDAQSAILLMAGYDLVMLGLAWFLWPFALESD